MSTSDYCFNSAKVTQNSQYILRITISIMYIQRHFVARKQFNECNFPNQSTLFGVHKVKSLRNASHIHSPLSFADFIGGGKVVKLV